MYVLIHIHMIPFYTTQDFIARCICLLSLDRFGDYSTGSLVAPVREVAAQLLALLVDTTSKSESVMKDDNGGSGSSLACTVMSMLEVLIKHSIWDVRHGGFLGLKFLIALPNQVSTYR